MRVYRASSLGYSLEALVAPHLGYSPVAPPEFLQKRFDEGTALEPLVIAELENLGWTVLTEQAEINSEGNRQIEVSLEVIPGKATLRGHLDGIGIEPPNLPSRVVEVKSMAEKSFKEACRLSWQTPGLIQKYKWQLSGYMLATGLEGVLVVCSKGEDGINNLLYMYAAEPFYTISDIANKLQQAEDHINAGTIPEGCTDFPCSYFYLHPPKDAPAPIDDELEPIIDAWLAADKRVKIFEAEKKVLREQIIEMLGEQEGLAPTIKSRSGVTISTTWQQGGEYSGTRKAGWITKIQGPRGDKGA